MAEPSPLPAWAAALAEWQENRALPLWTQAGIDQTSDTVWEALDYQGTPLRGLKRRQRVQFRQANVFARSPDPQIQDLGWRLFRRTMTHGFDPETGLFSAWISPDLQRLDQTHDLYDLAFGVLAAAHLGAAGFDVAPDIARLEEALSRLRGAQGWRETAADRQPRRQNPHMHLFEAMTALYALTKDPAHLAMAQHCLDLIAEHALTKDARLLEFFAPDWTPLEGAAQAHEPGHLAEWIYLADRFTATTGIASGLPLAEMWQRVQDSRLPSGFLPDRDGDTTRRLWPQTEFLKAACVMSRPETAVGLRPSDIAAQLWESYIPPSLEGGWYDQFDESTGACPSNNMPASTFYHIDSAIEACCRV